MQELEVKIRNIYNIDETGTILGASADTAVLRPSKKKSARVKALGDCG
jgi:hypothetical protein